MEHADKLEQLKSDANILANAYYDAQKELGAMRKLAAYVFPLLDIALTAGKVTANEARWLFMDIEQADNHSIAAKLFSQTIADADNDNYSPKDISEMFMSYEYWNSDQAKATGNEPPVPIFNENINGWAPLWKAYSRHVTKGRK